MGSEQAPEATALIDAASMEGLQARSRRGESIPPPPASDAQATSVLDTSKLSELVDESGSAVAPTVRPAGPRADPPVKSGRAKYTPTLRSADFEARQGSSTRPRTWPLVVGILTLGAGVGTFMGVRTIPVRNAAATVELTIRAEPQDVTMHLDDQLLTGNPHTSTHPRDGTRRSVILEAPGHEAQRIDVVLDASSTIDVVLSKTPPR